MANQITDSRTLVTPADAVGSFVGSTSPALSSEIFIQGTGSIAEQITSSERWVMFNAGSPQNWSNNVFYIWINCGIVGLLATRANGGFKIRFAGPTTTNYFEFNVGGSDSWPIAVQGGWVQFVVDIEGTPSGTGGTPPATSAIQHVGYAAVTAGTMTLVADNTWMDAIYRLPDNTPGIIVEGRNGGTTPWTFADIYSSIGIGSGALKQGPGGSYILNTPIQFGINDTTTHAFADSNQIILFESQPFVPADLYKLSALGNAGGTTSVTLGVKNGTGNAATGAQGCTIAANAAGVRWAIDFDDPNLNSVGLYGCSLIHGGDFQLDSTAIEVISSLYIDCSSATVSNSLQLKNSVIDANTADGVAFMFTDDLSDVRFCNFQFSDGHGVELLTPRVASQSSTGNLFSGYGATGSNDAAIYNNTGGDVTINVTDGGDSPTYRNGTGASTTVVAGTVTATVTVTTTTGTAIQNARVLVYANTGGPFPSNATVTISNSGTTATVTHTGHGLATSDKVMIRGASLFQNNGIWTITVTGTNTYTYTMNEAPGTSPTGTITSTFVVLHGLTDVSGQVTMSRVFPSNQPIIGRVRKSSPADNPRYRTSPIAGTVSSSTGFSTSVVMISDE